MRNTDYTKEQLRHGEELARLIAGFPDGEQKLILIAAESFMAGLNAGRALQESHETEVRTTSI